jgi:DNA/RNA-binding domain of Phe-tRNA-synthetase-like protein
MHFSHSPAIWSQFPELAACVLYAAGIHKDAGVATLANRFHDMARARLAAVASESELPEIQAWRRVFSRMGLKPTQYRCASESLLRRFRKEGPLPPLHPLIDLCNAASMAFAIPVAVFDLDQVAQGLEVRHAHASESYLAFSGETEHPEPREVIFADALGRAHARRWTHRQSGLSAVRDGTARVLIVAEAVHATAAADVRQLGDELAQALRESWGCSPSRALPTSQSPRFEF